MPYWTFATRNRSGVLSADLEPRDAKLTLRLNSYASLGGVIDARVSRASLFTPETATVVAWRDGTLRFNGQVKAPLARNLETVTFNVHDPYFNLTRRRRQSEKVFTAEDAGAIARELITDERARETLHLKNAATFDTSVNRDRTYPRGKQIAEAIAELVDAENGFYFRIDPVDDGADMAQMEILYPSSGTTKAEAIFWANDDSANLMEFEEQLGEPITHVVTLGAAEGDTQTLGEATDATAVTTYGLIDEEIAYTDIDDETLLDALATEALEAVPPPTYTFKPIPFHEDGEHVPTVFDHFTVGDLIRLVVKRGALNVDATVRVLEVTLAISNTGRTEQLERIVVEDAS